MKIYRPINNLDYLHGAVDYSGGRDGLEIAHL
jgi:hypothetical protein